MLKFFICGFVVGLIFLGVYKKINNPEASMLDLFINNPIILLEETEIGSIIMVIFIIIIISIIISIIIMLRKAGITTKEDIKELFEVILANIIIFIISYYKQLIKAIVILIALWISAYFIFSLFFFVIPISKYKTLITIMYIIGYLGLFLGILNIGLVIFNYYVYLKLEKPPETANKFIVVLLNCYYNLAVFLYRKKLIDKLFLNFWFQFCNQKQEHSNITALLSAFLIFTYAIFMKVYFRLFFEANTLSDNALLLIFVLFFVASLGLLYRLISNFSLKFVIFVQNFLPEIFNAVNKKHETLFLQFVGSDHQDDLHVPDPGKLPPGSQYNKLSSATDAFKKFIKKVPIPSSVAWMKIGVVFAGGTFAASLGGLKILSEQNRIARWNFATQNPAFAPSIFENRPKEFASWNRDYTKLTGKKPNDPVDLDSVFDSFLQHEFWYYINTIGITVILAAIFILTVLYFIKSRINNKIFKTSVEDLKDISAIYGMFYTSTIELAGRKGSRIFGLVYIMTTTCLIFVKNFIIGVRQPNKNYLSNNIFNKNTIFIGFVILLLTYIIYVSTYFYATWDVNQFYEMFQKLNYFLLPLLLGTTVGSVYLLGKASKDFFAITPLFVILFVITIIFFKYPSIFFLFSIFAATFSAFLYLPDFITNFIDTKIFKVKTKEKFILFLYKHGIFQFFSRFFILIIYQLDNTFFYFFVIWLNIVTLLYTIFARVFVHFTYVTPIVWSSTDKFLILFAIFVCLFAVSLRIITNFALLLVTITTDIRPDILLKELPKQSDILLMWFTPPPYGGGGGNQFNQYNYIYPGSPGPRMSFIKGAGLAVGVTTCVVISYNAWQTAKAAAAAERSALAAERMADQGEVEKNLRTPESYKKKWGDLDSVFDSFLQHEFWYYINTIGITVILAGIFIITILWVKSRIKPAIFKTYVEEIKDISSIYGMFYTSTIELAGRKGSRIFGLFLTIFIYLAILNLIGLLIVSVTVKSQLSTTFWFSLTIIISFILLGIRNKGLNFFLMFWNTGVGIGMRILLLFVEVLSFAIRPLSYALRLFANLLSGHILLHLFSKVINLLRKKNKFIPAMGPFVFLGAFGILETLIAVLQSFIPATLAQIWSNELL